MSNPGIPPQLAAMLSGGEGGPGAPEGMSAGAEAVAQSDIAKKGLACWKEVQALNGQRPESEDVKCLIQYVLTEGMGAPQAKEMADYLQSLGVQIPGVGPDSVGRDSPIPSASPRQMNIDDAEPE